MPLTFSLMEINDSLLYKGLSKSIKSQKFIYFFSVFFSVKTLANPHKLRYIQEVGFIGALYEQG